jgi:hypothetical protein
MIKLPTLNNIVTRGWRPRESNESCFDCGAAPYLPCRVAYGKGSKHAIPDQVLDWAHRQKIDKEFIHERI